MPVIAAARAARLLLCIGIFLGIYICYTKYQTMRNFLLALALVQSRFHAARISAVSSLIMAFAFSWYVFAFIHWVIVLIGMSADTTGISITDWATYAVPIAWLAPLALAACLVRRQKPVSSR